MYLYKLSLLFFISFFLFGCLESGGNSDLFDCGKMTESNNQPGYCFFEKISSCEGSKLIVEDKFEVIELSLAPKGDSSCAVGLRYISVDYEATKEVLGENGAKKKADFVGKSVTCDVPINHNFLKNYSREASDFDFEGRMITDFHFTLTSMAGNDDFCYGALADEAKEIWQALRS
tara:strand:- start:5485 stop:6009 length:525 start_codon:yes stop_codon:yes gene_type:complete